MSEEQPVVFVIDDDHSVREAVGSLLRSIGLDVRAFGSAKHFLSATPRSAGLFGPRCAVARVKRPGLTAGTGGVYNQIPIVFITGHGDIPMSVRAIKAGAMEFLVKPFRDQDLLDAVRQAIERDRVRRQDAAATPDCSERFNSLTPREREVMAQVVTGRLNKQIAAESL